MTADLPTPALLLDLDAFESNLAAAADLVRGTGTLLRPHVKAHRTPGLALRQLGEVARGVPEPGLEVSSPSSPSSRVASGEVAWLKGIR